MARLSLRMPEDHEEDRIDQECRLQDMAEDLSGEVEGATCVEEAQSRVGDQIVGYDGYDTVER